jgi:CHASE2 domain-containing sensor protein
MVWQDIVIMISCFGFALALIPTIKSPQKPTRSSCLLTFILLGLCAISFVTLGLWLSFASELTSMAAWAILYFQKRVK